MSVIHLDILDDAMYREEDGLVKEIRRVAIIEGFRDDTETFDETLEKALLDPLMPQPGDAHPHISGISLRERVPTARSTDVVQVELIYRPPGGLSVTPPAGIDYVLGGGASLTQIETQLDAPSGGSQITVTHDGITQGGVIRPYVPRPFFDSEGEFQGASPGTTALAYVGKLNNGGWSVDATAAARTWMCMGVWFRLLGYTTGGTARWSMRASFEYEAEGHDPDVIFIDPETGKPPPALVADTGYKTIAWYSEADFDTLLGSFI